MKNLIILFFLLPISNALAQGPIPFGEIDEVDLKMTVYEADSNAHAVVLHDYQKITGRNVDYQTSMTYYRHIRIKILDPAAFDLATIELHYAKRYSVRITGIKAQTINWENGKMVKKPIPKSDIFEEKVTKRQKAKKFTFPDLKVGSIIEYEYYMYNMYPYQIWHSFQGDIPVRWSEVKIILPDYLRYRFDFNQTTLPIAINEQKKTTFKGGPVIDYHFAMKDIPALKEESYVSNMADYQAALQMFISYNSNFIEPVVISDWKNLNDKYLKQNGKCFNSKGYYKKAFKANEALITGDTPPKEKMIQLYNHIAQTIDWDGDYDAEPSELNLNTAYKNKKGSSAEINLLLLGLLKKAGITAHPVLISTRDNGRINPAIPFLYQFDQVLVKAEIDGKFYFLDAVNPNRPYNLLSFQDLTPFGWQLDDTGGKWVDLPKFKSRHVIVPTFELSADGTVTGKVNMALEGFLAHSTRRDIREAQEKDKNYVQEEYKDKLSDLEITDLEVKNLKEKDKRLTLAFKAESSSFATVSGDLIYFSPVWMTEFKENPFKSETRTMNVDLGYQIEEHYVMKLKIPEGYTIEDIPKSAQIALPEKTGSFTFIVQKDSEKQLSIISRLTINSPTFSAEFYPYLRKFFDMVAEKQNEQVVLKKVP